MAQQTSFLGTGWGFPPTFKIKRLSGVVSAAEPSVEDQDQAQRLGLGRQLPCSKMSAKVVMVSDEDDICESIKILLHTSLGERVMQPKYGANLTDQVFEPMNTTTLTLIEDLIRTALIYHEPRIKTDNVTVTPDQASGTLTISIDYIIRASNSRFNVVFPFFLAEGSEII